MSCFPWTRLPQEMKGAVLDNLALPDVWACARSSRDSYEACLPILFRTVNLPSLEALIDFLKAVPSHRYRLIRNLHLSTKSTSYHPLQFDGFTRPEAPEACGAVDQLLTHCASLESFAFTSCGTVSFQSILAAFRGMDRVKSFRLENVDDEESRPFSERLAVSLAFSLPSLEDLSLTRITRSAKHATELQWSNVPIVAGDDEIPSHPIIGNEMRLPQLLRLPNLKRLRIRDTHLGDPMWAEVEACCPLEVIDLGSCAHVSPAENALHTQQILARVAPTLEAFALGASLPSALPDELPSPVSCHKPASYPAPSSHMDTTPIPPLPTLPRLRTLHLTPLVPTSALQATLTQPALASSPVHTLSCTFHPDDAADGCAALESFLRARANGTRRPRASSRLGLCNEPECFDSTTCEIPAPSGSGATSSRSRARANTAPILTCAAEVPYPALRTLAIDIPAEEALSPLSPTGRMSARRLAAAQRRAEMRKQAAQRVQALAKDLGLEVLMHGIDADAAPGCGEAAVAKSGLLRARSNTA